MEGRSMKQHHKKKRESNHNGAIDENEIPRFKKRQAGSLNSTNSKILRQKGFQDKSDAFGGNKSDRGGERKHLQDKSDELARTNAFKGKSDEGSGRKRFQDKSDERGRAHGFKDNSDVSGRKNDFRERSDSSRPKSGFEKSDAVHHNKAFQEKFPRLNRNTGFENKSDLRGGRKDFKHKSDEWGRKDSFENKSDLVGRKKAFQDKSDVLGRKNGFNNNRDAGGGKKDFQHKGDHLGRKNSFENKYDGVDRRKSFHDMSDTTGRKKGTKDKFDDVENRPKREKKAMRIDPNDISNKRLDDGISFDGKVVEKKVDPEKNVELSKNAQFRAIQPDPSILSFVEDNLLGRRRLIELRRAGYNIEVPAPLDNIPGSTSSERERVEEPVFGNKLTFFAAAKVASSFPPPELPEIAFAGRSNVGKSSLLNALTRQWGVVRTSDKPGLTQTINFFNLGQKFSLVDLPGYGFAYAKEEVKDAWEELVKEYVSTRVGIKQVCLLIDTKWGMKPRDHELIDLMERSQTKYQIVLTKTDVVFPIDVARRAMQIEQTLKANKSVVQPVMMVSSKSGAGIRSLRTVLSKIMRFAKV